jgi:hypothetical protein
VSCPCAQRLPHPLVFEREWSGILGFTKDRWPLVGALPRELRCSGSSTSRPRAAPAAQTRDAGTTLTDQEDFRACGGDGNGASGLSSVSIGANVTSNCDLYARQVTFRSHPPAASALAAGEFCCMGFSGHGMTRAMTCARNLAAMLAGLPQDAWFPASVLDPARVLRDDDRDRSGVAGSGATDSFMCGTGRARHVTRGPATALLAEANSIGACKRGFMQPATLAIADSRRDARVSSAKHVNAAVASRL